MLWIPPGVTTKGETYDHEKGCGCIVLLHSKKLHACWKGPYIERSESACVYQGVWGGGVCADQ